MSQKAAKAESTVDNGEDNGRAESNFNEEVHYSMLVYLKKLGYRQTESIFREEARSAGIETIAFEMRAEQDSSFQPAIILGDKATEASRIGPEGAESSAHSQASHSGGEFGYEAVFSRLKKWIYDSLDIYRDELNGVLYPMFVHCFLDLMAKNTSAAAHKFFDKFKDEFVLTHGDELQKLYSLNDPAQLKENSLVVIYRNNKYNLSMSAYAFQLLVNFLQENSMFILLKILNQYLSVRVLVSRPLNAAGPAKGTNVGQESRSSGLVGLSATLAGHVNSEPILWGVSQIDSLNESEILRRLRNDISSTGTYKTADQLNNAVSQAKKTLVSTADAAPKTLYLSRPQAGVTELEYAVDRIKNLSNRAALSSTNLPSICCYTVHNSYNGICSSDFSHNFNLMALGNRESFIDVWSLTREKLKSIRPSTELSAMSTHDLENFDRIFADDDSISKRLTGHAGPVFGCRFSPDGQFLFSCSQDQTVRLWSLGTYSSIMAYRSHMGPVWDVDVGASGHYFVTASADKTARLWSTQSVQPLRMFVGHFSDVDVVRFHPNCNYVATGSSDKTIRLWDINKASCVRLFTGHLRGVSAVALSPNGRLLASGDSTGVIKIWDIAEGKLMKTCAPSLHELSARKYPIYSLSFCEDSKILASSSADNFVRLWDVDKSMASQTNSAFEEPVASYATKQTAVISVRFTPRNILNAIGIFNSD